VYRALKRALAEDKARTNVLEISALGLVEMTRKRVRQDLRPLLTMSCPTCRGSAVIRSDATLAAEIFRGVQAKAAESTGRDIVVRVHPDMAAYFEGDGRDGLARLSTALDLKVGVQAATGLHREEYQIQTR
jgi:ribonuclease G